MPESGDRFSEKFAGHGHQDPHTPGKMTGCAKLRSKRPAGLLHMAKQAPGSCGNGPRIGLDKAQNTLLLARHAVFRGSADDHRRLVKSQGLRYFGVLLLECNNYSPVKPKKVTARALFSVSRVVQSGTRFRIFAAAQGPVRRFFIHHCY
jgi:hypothetical protein